jgi:hypothetical protein
VAKIGSGAGISFAKFLRFWAVGEQAQKARLGDPKVLRLVHNRK